MSQRCILGLGRMACINDKYGAKSYDDYPPSAINMLTVRNILVALICASPVILVWNGLIAQGGVAGISAIALVITARNLRPGETEFLVSTVRSRCWRLRYQR